MKRGIQNELKKILALLEDSEIPEIEVAKYPGRYGNFTGEIHFNGKKVAVKNSTFELERSGNIWWFDNKLNNGGKNE